MATKRNTREGKTMAKVTTNQNASLAPAISELERVFNSMLYKFGKALANAKVIIAIQSRGRKKSTLGWYGNGLWDDSGTPTAEINICAESLDRPVLEVLETLVHEMVHAANCADGIKDHSGNSYHNKAFRDRCHSVGLTCDKVDKHGWALTGLTPELAKELKALKVNKKAFEMARLPMQKKKQPPRLIKLQCPCCGYTVRTTAKWLATGLPSCPFGIELAQV